MQFNPACLTVFQNAACIMHALNPDAVRRSLYGVLSTRNVAKLPFPAIRDDLAIHLIFSGWLTCCNRIAYLFLADCHRLGDSLPYKVLTAVRVAG